MVLTSVVINSGSAVDRSASLGTILPLVGTVGTWAKNRDCPDQIGTGGRLADSDLTYSYMTHTPSRSGVIMYLRNIQSTERGAVRAVFGRCSQGPQEGDHIRTMKAQYILHKTPINLTMCFLKTY